MELIFENEYSKEFDNYEEIFLDLTKYAVELLNRNSNFSLEVNLVDNETIHEINRDYRQIDRPTDVISFAFLDEVEGELSINYGDNMFLLGEILISIDKAKEQAQEYGHSLHREICFLFIHGLLHLLGYDHQDEEQEKVMFELQNKILNNKGVLR